MKIGQHFTPYDLAYNVVSKAIAPLVQSGMDLLDIKILDPACGDGSFLHAAVDYVSEHAGVAKSVVERNIYGIDIDIDVVDICRSKFKNATIYCADALFFDPGITFDCIIGNPPFLGGGKISSTFGDEYLKRIKLEYPRSGGTADYCAYFFRRAYHLLGEHGTIGFIATNTIAQGDTRSTGLKWLVSQGCTVYDSIKSTPWPGAAAVTVAIVRLAKGSPMSHIQGPIFNSRLGTKPERPDPHQLAENSNRSFQGSIVLGMGFTLTPEEREALVARNPKNAERIFPYIGGEEVNTSPTQDFHRYVINFGQMSLEEAASWPDLLEIVREKVKPERDRVKRVAHKKYWWHYGDKRPALYRAIQNLPRCLVTLFTTKHLTFSFQPTDRIFANTLRVLPFDRYAPFTLLQSRVHEFWAWLLSSTMRQAGIRYAATDCFENFPFPDESQLGPDSKLESLGQRLYEARARFMVETQQGITLTYNALKDPFNSDPRIVELRELHWEMDRAVLTAYGWDDLAVPPYGTPTTRAEERVLEWFHDEVIDRLFVLNAERFKKQNRQLKLIDGYANTRKI